MDDNRDDNEDDSSAASIILLLLAFLFASGLKYLWPPYAQRDDKKKKKKDKVKTDDTTPPTEKPTPDQRPHDKKKKDNDKTDDTTPPTEKPTPEKKNKNKTDDTTPPTEKPTPEKKDKDKTDDTTPPTEKPTPDQRPHDLFSWTTGAILTISLGIFSLGQYFMAPINPLMPNRDILNVIDDEIDNNEVSDSSENSGVTLPTIPLREINIYPPALPIDLETLYITPRRKQSTVQQIIPISTVAPELENSNEYAIKILDSIITDINNEFDTSFQSVEFSVQTANATENINNSQINKERAKEQAKNIINKIEEAGASVSILDSSNNNEIEEQIRESFEEEQMRFEEEQMRFQEEEYKIIVPEMIDLEFKEETMTKENSYAQKEMSVEQKQQEKQNVVNAFKKQFEISQSIRKLRLPNFNPSIDDLFNETNSVLLGGNEKTRAVFYKLISDALNKTSTMGVTHSIKQIILEILRDFIKNLSTQQHNIINNMITELKSRGFQNWDNFKSRLKVTLTEQLSWTIERFIAAIKQKLKIQRFPQGFRENILDLIRKTVTDDINKIIEIFENGRNKIIRYVQFLSSEANVQLFFETYLEKYELLKKTLYSEAKKIYYSLKGNAPKTISKNFFVTINTFLSENVKKLKYSPRIKRLQEIYDLLNVLENEKKLMPPMNMGVYVSIALYNSILYKLLSGQELTPTELIQLEELYKLPYIQNVGVFIRRAGKTYIEDLPYK